MKHKNYQENTIFASIYECRRIKVVTVARKEKSMKDRLRTIVVGSDQMTVEIFGWLNAHDCDEIEFEAEGITLVKLPPAAWTTTVVGNCYAVHFSGSLKFLEITLNVDVFSTVCQLLEIEV